LRRFDQVVAKIAFDRRIRDTQAVVSGLAPDADRASLAELDAIIRYFKTCDVQTAPELAGMRALHRLPWPLAAVAFRMATGRLRRRPDVLGTFSVSSLGHRAVSGFYPLGGTAVSIGVGRVRDRPVVRDGAIVTAPTMRLGLVFDHRVFDGALAADLLDDIVSRLEHWEPQLSALFAADGARAVT
jgi:pyruvate/2-oxoglutarate dehydrogenase complex dihydrolipoamide acyltransferase (E2) component